MATYLDMPLKKAITEIYCWASGAMFAHDHAQSPEDEQLVLARHQVSNIVQLKIEAYVMQKYGEGELVLLQEVMDGYLYECITDGKDVIDKVVEIINDILPHHWKEL